MTIKDKKFVTGRVVQNTQDKTDAMAALDGDYESIFGFDELDADDNATPLTLFNDPAACISCAE